MQHSSVQAGVGIFFQQENDGSVIVKTIVSGGSAEREGYVQVGKATAVVGHGCIPMLPHSTIAAQNAMVPCKHEFLASRGRIWAVTCLASLRTFLVTAVDLQIATTICTAAFFLIECVHVCVCIYIYTYIHTYIHTYTHTHTHIPGWGPNTISGRA
jgi:hypothetical protein